jgi:hypothetical protein
MCLCEEVTLAAMKTSLSSTAARAVHPGHVQIIVRIRVRASESEKAPEKSSAPILIKALSKVNERRAAFRTAAIIQ